MYSLKDRSLVSRIMIGAGAVVLACCYFFFYFTSPILPWQPLLENRGWWSWSDQSQYLLSVSTLAHFNFSETFHWYPLGYSIAGAPFARIVPAHPFFLVDLFSLLGAYAGFLVLVSYLRVRLAFAIPIFLLTTFGDPRIASVWVEPWNTTMSAGFIWGLIGLSAHILYRPEIAPPRLRVIFLLGVFAGVLPLVRPTDMLLTVIVLSWVGGVAFLRGWVNFRRLAVLCLGLAFVIIPYGALYLRIYGLHFTPYMMAERGMGFVPGWLGWKLYVLLISPYPWYPTGVSILARFPWVVLSFSGILLLVLRPRRMLQESVYGLLSVLIIACWLTFIAYIDVLPTSLWRYNNIHYFKWTFPGLGLLALYFIERLFEKPKRLFSLVSIVVIGLVSMIHLVAVPAKSNQSAAMIQLPGTHLSWETAYFGNWHFADTDGSMDRPLSVRVIPDAEGVRLLPQRRTFQGQVSWEDQPSPQMGTPIRWAAKLSLGYPCWLPPYPCDLYAPKN